MIPIRRLPVWSWLAGGVVVASVTAHAGAAETAGAAQFHQSVQPILEQYCYDCHGDGKKKGNVAFDALHSDGEILDHELWSKALGNLRSGIMPPPGEARPTAAEQKRVEDWVKYAAFGIDPKNPDPGRVTLRRLNRAEYRNTIRDLMGVDFNTDVEFPPDDTGYGFDDIGDVLTVSPMLLEKYMVAATTIVDQAVPKVSSAMRQTTISGNTFLNGGRAGSRGNRGDSLLGMSYYFPATVSNVFQAEFAGTYRLALELSVKGTFDFDPGKCRVIFKVDDQELLNKEFSWEDSKTFLPFEFEQQWQPGAHRMSFELQPLVSADQQLNSLEMRINAVTVQGPEDEKYWTKPKNFDRFFTREAPSGASERRKYAREVLGNFAQKAFRRPVDGETLDRLVALAEGIYQEPGKTFEAGIGQAMVAALASPRFLFHNEGGAPSATKEAYPLVDEYSLASRLSYFLWSTMPDAELMRLAGQGQLRKNLAAQVKRMLADPRSDALVNNFTGQWLQVRDVEGMTINSEVVLARDKGEEQLLKRQQADRQARFAQPNANAQPGINRPRLQRPANLLDAEMKRNLERETQMVFGSIVHEDRSVLELLDSDYTFLNQKLAGFYGLTNLNVTGNEMRRVTLPPDSPRGGVLTEGTVLLVTSNPDRTSPVKRGLFVLSHILGSPTPPPPPNIPALEVAEKSIHDHEPTLRETLQEHRDKPECNACHSRLDPLGLAFENFNALGMWRDKERTQTIDPAGQLITGESFQTVRELKHILATNHREEFYRCLTEKMLTYATGRGVEYYDTETVDQIVQRLETENGRMSALLTGIIDSAPFQKERRQANASFADAPEPASQNPVGKLTKKEPTP